MADLATIRAGIARNLAVIPDVQVSAYILANPTPPVIQILPGAIEWDLAYARGLDKIMLKVQAFVALNDDVGSQVTLDKYLNGSGPLSVKTAIESDETLGGIVGTAQVTSTGDVQLYTGGSTPMLFVEWEVEVLARGV
jgi:hypothetical protein